VITIALPLLNL